MTDPYLTLTNTLFGVSRGLDADEQIAIRNYLRAAWMAQYGDLPSTLSVDLEILSKLFGSHIQARRLRDAAEGLRKIDEPRPLMPEAIFVAVDDHRGFVTPEGRVLLAHLDQSEQVVGQTFSRDTVLMSNALVADFYGGSQRRWMRKEIAGGDVRPPTLGFAIFLLINNSIGSKHALLLPSSLEEEGMLAGRVLPVVTAFSVAVGGNPVKPRERERLRSNWVVTEAKRQIGRYISRADTDHVVRLWIEPDRENGLVDELGRQLAKRRTCTASSVREALQKTLEAYNLARSMLTSWGLAHERAGHTQRVFDDLIDAYLRSIQV